MARHVVGVDCGEGPPVPIPNTEVKLTCAEDTWLEAARKNRSSPTFLLLSLVYKSIQTKCENLVHQP